ncbi:MAG TPA: hypothetical protein VEZ90_12480 [Blastocatellia bacterium]|nr:hypothetical protein [Blastocatellia bacterium]
MRDKVWSNLANVKFKAMYSYQYSRSADRIGRLTSWFLALASASSVAAWAFWKAHPAIWGGIIAVSQVLQVTKPYLPVIGSDKELLEMSFDYEQLFLEYEKLWNEVESESVDEKAVTQRIEELHKKALEIERTHRNVHIPTRKRLSEQVYADVEKFLKLNFG